MGKLLFWIAVIALIWLVWSLVRVSQRKHERGQGQAEANGAAHTGPPGGRAKAPSAHPEQMIACDRCGVFLPASDSVQGRDGRYCCPEHRDAGRR